MENNRQKIDDKTKGTPLDDLIREVEQLTVPEMQETTGVLSYDELFEITGSRCWSPPMEVEAYQKVWLAIKNGGRCGV